MDHYAASLELKTVDVQQRIISGYPAAHHNIDRVKDIIDPQASVKAMGRITDPAKDVAVFIGHQTDALPVGHPITIQATPRGLYTETYIYKGPAGDNLLAVAKDMQDRGLPLGMSIGYRTHDSRHEMAGRKRVRRILDYELKEYSFAAHQTVANPDATAIDVKALSEGIDGAGGALVPPDDMADDAYRLEVRGGRFHVVDSGGTSLVDFGTELEARAALTALQADAAEDRTGGEDTGGKTTSAAGDTKAEWSTATVNDLPDANFLFIEDGGQKDDEGKTVPRSKRHFPYKDKDGSVDAAHLRDAIGRIPQSNAPGLDKARLQARARVLLEKADSGKTVDDADEWKAGAALAVRGLAYQLLDLSDTLATELKAMALLGEETKGGARIRPEVRARLSTVAAEVKKLVDHAERIERGEDGKARVSWYRQQFAFADV